MNIMCKNISSNPTKPESAEARVQRVRKEVADALKVRSRIGTPAEKLEVVMTSAGLDKLENATVMVLGLGGVGSSCTEALARGGIGNLIIVDGDIVSESNINRQAIAFTQTLGHNKTDVMQEMIASINPACNVQAINKFMLSSDVEAFMQKWASKADMVIDAIDSVAVKLAIAQFAYTHNVKLISSMGGANKLHPEMLKFSDISKTVNCPLSRVMRKECRRRGIKKLEVLFSAEQPLVRPAIEGAARSERTNLGTASFMPPIMGQMIAGRVLCQLAEVPDYEQL